MEQRILNGWKEISSHLDRGTRTAQRWEIQFGMPVHRPASKRRAAVVAFADELDAWLIRKQGELSGDSARHIDETDPAHLREILLRLKSETRELHAKLLHLERHLHETVESGGKNSPWREISTNLEARR